MLHQRLKIDVDKDRVTLVFEQKGKDLPLSLEQANVLANALLDKADEAEAWVRAGGSRKTLSLSRRAVGVRVIGHTVHLVFPQRTDREDMPYEAARRLAQEIEREVKAWCYREAYREAHRQEDLPKPARVVSGYVGESV